MRTTNRRSGFTLVELMIVVGLIGALAAIAIPAFVTYQARSRRAEAYANLAAVARAQKSFQAERDAYHHVALSQPGGVPGTTKMPWDAASEAAFGPLGFEPEGAVFYSYEVVTPQAPVHACTCTGRCFTASAFGDVDGDTLMGEVMYVEPERDADGVITGECPNNNQGSFAPTDSFGQPIYNEVAIRRDNDDF